MSQSGSLNRGGSGPDIDILTSFTGGAGTAGTFPVVPNGAGQIQLSSSGGTIQITGALNSLNLEATGSVLNVTTLTGDSGGPVSPTGNNINTLGSGSITIVGSPGTSTLTTELTGLTNHAVLVGAGTSTITKLAIGATNQVLLGNTGADPFWGTVPNAALTNSSVTINSGNNITVTGGSPLALGGIASIAVTGTTNHSVQVGNASGSLTSVANGLTGQVFQANTGADPTWSTATYPSTATSVGVILRADGTNWVPTNAVYPNSTTINQVLYSSSNNNITGVLAGNDGVFISSNTGVPSWLANGTTGQVLTATAGSPPSWQNASLPSNAIISLTGNTGGAVGPTANNINTIGSGSITVVGSPGTSTLTASLTGLTNHAVLIGAGTDTITKVGPSSATGQVLQSQGLLADPAFSTATYPSTATGTGTILRADGTNWVATTATYPNTTTINQILYSSANNVISEITAGNDGVLISSNTGVPSWLANGTTGQVLTATTGSPPSWTTLSTSFNPATTIQVVEDFIGASSGWHLNSLGGSALGTTTNPGQTTNISTLGVNAASMALLDVGAFPSLPLVLGLGLLQINFVYKLAILSTGTNTYTAYIGLTDGKPLLSSTAPTNGCYFQYTNGTNSGKWQIVCNKAGSATTADSGVTANTSFNNFQVSVNAAGTSVSFFINGVETSNSPIATNIPVVSLTGSCGILRNAGTIAINTHFLDLAYLQITMTTPR